MKPRVLVAEDEETIALVVSRSLEAAGCEVVTVGDGAEALEAGLREDFDVAVLDLMLPTMVGTEVLLRWKQAKRPFPVIMLSAMTGEDDVIRGLELGAVDYIRKPFSVRELIARVKAQLRRDQGPEVEVG